MHTHNLQADDVIQQEPLHRGEVNTMLSNHVNRPRYGTAPRGYERKDVWMERKKKRIFEKRDGREEESGRTEKEETKQEKKEREE